MPKKVKAKKQRFGLAVSVYAQLLLGLCYIYNISAGADGRVEAHPMEGGKYQV